MDFALVTVTWYYYHKKYISKEICYVGDKVKSVNSIRYFGPILDSGFNF